jgi:hypothetical protein
VSDADAFVSAGAEEQEASHCRSPAPVSSSA